MAGVDMLGFFLILYRGGLTIGCSGISCGVVGWYDDWRFLLGVLAVDDPAEKYSSGSLMSDSLIAVDVQRVTGARVGPLIGSRKRVTYKRFGKMNDKTHVLVKSS